MADSSNKPWLVSQYWFLVGQLQQRDTGFTAPYSSTDLDSLDVNVLSRIVNDLKRLSSVPPIRG